MWVYTKRAKKDISKLDWEAKVEIKKSFGKIRRGSFELCQEDD